jgi:hypothetical protein
MDSALLSIELITYLKPPLSRGKKVIIQFFFKMRPLHGEAVIKQKNDDSLKNKVLTQVKARFYRILVQFFVLYHCLKVILLRFFS